jgi:hypothetical protein
MAVAAVVGPHHAGTWGNRPLLAGTVRIMDIDLARDFVRRHHRAVLTSYYPGGRAQLSPVTVGVDEAGQVVISTRETATKTRNLTRDPRVSLRPY